MTTQGKSGAAYSLALGPRGELARGLLRLGRRWDAGNRRVWHALTREAAALLLQLLRAAAVRLSHNTISLFVLRSRDKWRGCEGRSRNGDE